MWLCSLRRLCECSEDGPQSRTWQASCLTSFGFPQGLLVPSPVLEVTWKRERGVVIRAEQPREPSMHTAQQPCLPSAPGSPQAAARLLCVVESTIYYACHYHQARSLLRRADICLFPHSENCILPGSHMPQPQEPRKAEFFAARRNWAQGLSTVLLSFLGLFFLSYICFLNPV